MLGTSEVGPERKLSSFGLDVEARGCCCKYRNKVVVAVLEKPKRRKVGRHKMLVLTASGVSAGGGGDGGLGRLESD